MALLRRYRVAFDDGAYEDNVRLEQLLHPHDVINRQFANATDGAGDDDDGDEDASVYASMTAADAEQAPAAWSCSTTRRPHWHL